MDVVLVLVVVGGQLAMENDGIVEKGPEGKEKLLEYGKIIN